MYIIPVIGSITSMSIFLLIGVKLFISNLGIVEVDCTLELLNKI